MTYFADLSPWGDASDQLTAVGWLESDREYHRGDVPVSVVARLMQLLIDPWQPAVTAGYHDCSFCRVSGGPHQFTFNGTTIDVGNSNLFVPADGQIFIAPSLILHYIDAHGYAPPQSFQDAVLACPDMQSKEYLAAIRKTPLSNYLPS